MATAKKMGKDMSQQIVVDSIIVVNFSNIIIWTKTAYICIKYKEYDIVAINLKNLLPKNLLNIHPLAKEIRSKPKPIESSAKRVLNLTK